MKFLQWVLVEFAGTDDEEIYGVFPTFERAKEVKTEEAKRGHDLDVMKRNEDGTGLTTEF